jgi:nucleoside-triphosphatase THEP1
LPDPGLQTRNLARLANSRDTDIIGKWKMNKESIAWVRAYLLDLQPADLWIVDEIGPYEIVQGKGWADILPCWRKLPAKRFW